LLRTCVVLNHFSKAEIDSLSVRGLIEMELNVHEKSARHVRHVSSNPRGPFPNQFPSDSHRATNPQPFIIALCLCRNISALKRTNSPQMNAQFIRSSSYDVMTVMNYCRLESSDSHMLRVTPQIGTMKRSPRGRQLKRSRYVVKLIAGLIARKVEEGATFCANRRRITSRSDMRDTKQMNSQKEVGERRHRITGE
jgi:hypothetical protein